MTRHFDLSREPWISVRFENGSEGMVGWRDLITRSGEIADVVTDPPHVYGIVVRLATALVLRTQDPPLGDPSPGSWQSWGAERLATGVDATTVDQYFTAWADRFWLLDEEHPFLQDPAIQTECATEAGSTNKLLFTMASGNNLLWWTKVLDADAPSLSFAVAAQALLAQWGYAAGGTCTSRCGVKTSIQAPQRGYTQFLPRGSSFFETLLMSCVPAPSDAELAARDAPFWELEPDASVVPGQMARLTASTRGLLLIGNESGVIGGFTTWGKGDRGASFWEADVFMARKVDSKTNTPKSVCLAFTDVSWREAPAILAAQSEGAGRTAPIVFDPSRNPLDATHTFSRAGVTVVTHFADKATDLGWSRSEVPRFLAAAQGADPARYFNVEQFCGVAAAVLPQLQHLLTPPKKKQRLRSHGAREDEDEARREREDARAVPEGELLVRNLWLDAEYFFYAVVDGERWEVAARLLLRRILERFDEETEAAQSPARIRSVLRTRQELIHRISQEKMSRGLLEEEQIPT